MFLLWILYGAALAKPKACITHLVDVFESGWTIVIHQAHSLLYTCAVQPSPSADFFYGLVDAFLRTQDNDEAAAFYF